MNEEAGSTVSVSVSCSLHANLAFLTPSLLPLPNKVSSKNLTPESYHVNPGNLRELTRLSCAERQPLQSQTPASSSSLFLPPFQRSRCGLCASSAEQKHKRIQGHARERCLERRADCEEGQCMCCSFTCVGVKKGGGSDMCLSLTSVETPPPSFSFSFSFFSL